MMKTFISILVLGFFVTTTSAQSIFKDAKKPRVVPSQKFGNYYYLKSKQKGLVLCFHGNGGNGANWAKKTENKKFLDSLSDAGYGFLCPSSLGKKWHSKDGKKSKDLKRVEALLNALGENRGPLFLVGHSNGGGFASFFSGVSNHRGRIKGIQYSNSSGIDQVLRHPGYRYPTLFVGASCDKVADFKSAQRNHKTVLQKGMVRSNIHNLRVNYLIARSKTCHEFVNSSNFFLNFFDGNPHFDTKQRR